MLKAQHPGYELFKEGTHGKRGIACADCHMPYKVEGGIKFSDHHVRSPLENVQNACQQCHRMDADKLLSEAASFKTKVLELKRLAEEELVAAHFEAKKAWEVGASEQQMAEPLLLIRHAQWRWDFATAAHGSYFHAPEEALRILGTAVQKASAARLALVRLLHDKGYRQPVTIPSLQTKALAQKVVGLDAAGMQRDKDQFLGDLARKWWAESPVRDDKMMDLVTKGTALSP